MSDQENVEPEKEKENQDAPDREEGGSEKEGSIAGVPILCLTQEPTCQDYMSFYNYQNDWIPTRPLQPISAYSSSPGPATVQLPACIGANDLTKPRAPAYKMGARCRIPGDYANVATTGPGPATYETNHLTNKGKDKDWGPVMDKAKRFTDKIDDRSPGPAFYNKGPGDKMVYQRGPAYSMGKSQRGEHWGSGTGPGPNTYSLPTAFGPGQTPIVTGPSYSIGKGQRGTFDSKFNQTPGPEYMLPDTNKYMNRAPGFYMGVKTPAKAIDEGGPLYKTHLVKYDKQSTPRITFGIRHSPFKAIPGFDAEK